MNERKPTSAADHTSETSPTAPASGGRVEQFATNIYESLWSILIPYFKVPRHPPELPVGADEMVERFQPSPDFLRYLKFKFWLVLVIVDVAIVVGWLIIFFYKWWLGLLLLGPALIIAIVPDIIAYVAIHLRYDTTWYLMTNRAMRLRRGVWIIHETTITYENIQNLSVNQGPLQRYFGIANLTVETAGGGGGGEGHGSGIGVSNQGVIEGIANAHELRDRVLQRLRQSRSAGLGDDLDEQGMAPAAPGTHHISPAAPRWTPAHIAALREIRDGLRAVVAARTG